MPQPLVLELTPEQRYELERARDQDSRPYVRERAAALLKIATGQSGRQVAFHGLLKHRRADTVYSWVHRYQSAGLSGLYIQTGRGRKPAFPRPASGGRKRP